MSLIDLLQMGDKKPGNLMSGAVIGVVIDNMDPEGLGRVKVSFPWMACDNESSWARVATLMAGKEKGTFFIPDEGDEVLIVFGEGDIQNPYIIGALWNGREKPPKSNPDHDNNTHSIVTKSGMEITFYEQSGSEKIEIKDKSGSNHITIDIGQKSIIIESGSEIKIKSNNVTVESTANMTLKAGANMEIQATGNLTLKADGITEVKGSMVKIN